jgi:phytoene synthase
MKTEFYIKHHGKSFYWAGKFLKKEIFNDCSILYAFCRVVDNLVDEKSNSKNNIKNFIKDYQSKNSKNLVINKFKKIEAKYKIPKKYVQDLFYGVSLDTKPVKIKTTKELLKYSYYVAGTVGAMMAYIFNTTNSKAIKCAVNLGIAMQLTNISRDVVKDAYLQRIYIPENFLKENITVKNIINNNFNKKNLFFSIKKIILLAEKYYISGNSGIKFLPRTIKFPIFLASKIYQGIGKKILNDNENIYFLKRTYLNFLEKIIMTIKSYYIYIIIKGSYKK